MSETAKKKVVLLGATGSIGGSALRVLREHADRLELIGVAAHSSHAALAAICHEFNVPHATLSSEAAYAEANAANNFPANTQLGCGDAGLLEISTLAEADIVLVAVAGSCGLKGCGCLYSVRTCSTCSQQQVQNSLRFLYGKYR